MSYAKALHAFPGDPADPTQIPLTPGDVLQDVLEIGNGWSEGCKTSTGQKGIFPSTYIEKIAPPAPPAPPAAPKPMAPPAPPGAPSVPKPTQAAQNPLQATSSGKESAKGEADESAAEAKLVAEIENSVRAWRGKLMTALVEQEFTEYNRVKNQISTLLEWRRQLQDSGSKQHEWVRRQVIRCIESRRQTDEAFTVPRTADDGVATPENTTIAELHDKHKEMEKRMLDGKNLPTSIAEQFRAEEKGGQRQGKDSSDDDDSSGGTPSHLYVNVKAAIFSTPDPVQIVFSLWTKADSSAAKKQDRRQSSGLGGMAIPEGSPAAGGGEQQSLEALGGGEYVQVSEEFLVGLTNKGFPEDPELFDQLCTVFVDVPRSTMRDHLFLVCRIYRIGTLNPDPKAKKNLAEGARSIGDVNDSSVIFRRPFGVGVMDLANIDAHQYEHGKEVEQTMFLFKTCNSEGYGFPALHVALMKAGNRAVEGVSEKIPQCTGVVVGLGVFDGTIPELMQKEKNKPFDEGKKNLKLTRHALDKKMEMGRNDLYITLVGGKFAQDGKKSAKNVEIKMTVLDNAANEVPCLTKGTGRQSVTPYATYRSCVYYHLNTPTYMETVRLQIPEGDLFERSHLFFIISHCKDDKRTARNPSTFAFLPLAANANGVAIPDGEHVLKGYKLLPGMEKTLKDKTASYLTTDPSKLTLHMVKSLIGATATPEEIVVHVRLVSTKKTQISELHNLINWRRINDPRALEDTFESLIRNYKWTDIVKMLRELLDAVITLLRDPNNKLPEKVFYFFSYVLNEVARPQNKSALPVLDDYISRLNHEAMGDLHVILVRHIRRHLTWVSKTPFEEEKTGMLRNGLGNTLFSLHLHMRIVKVSFQAAEAKGKGGGAFIGELTALVDQIVSFMDISSPAWVLPAQNKLLRRMASALLSLEGFLPISTISDKVNTMLGKLQAGGPGSSDSQNVDKLLLIRHIVQGYIFQDDDSRIKMIPSLVEVLSGHLRSPGQPRHLAVMVLNDVLKVVQANKTKDEDTFSEAIQNISGLTTEILSAVESALDDESPETDELVAALIRDEADYGGEKSEDASNVRPVSDAATALLSLIRLQSTCNDSSVMEMNTMHLRGLLSVFGSLLTTEVYSNEWIVMNMLQYQVTLKVLEFASGHLNAASFLGVQDIRASTADGLGNLGECDDLFFVVGLKLLREESLDLTSDLMSTARRNFIEQVGKYGDIRAEVVTVLETRWNNVSLEKRADPTMIDLMVKPLLELVESSSPEVSIMARKMFFELLRAEFKSTKNFLSIGRHAVDAIDDIMIQAHKQTSTDRAEPALLVMFRDELSKKFNEDPDLNQPEAQRFLTETTELFGLLSDLSRYPKTSEYEDERVFAYTKLMEFLEKLKRYDAYIKYAHAMSKELSALGLHAEAAQALLLHVKHLKCDTPAAETPVGGTVLGGELADFVSVQDMVRTGMGIEVSCHGDCKGPGGIATELLDEADFAHGVAFPRQTALARRAKLYEMAMDLFDQGQQWELAIELAEALKRQYSSVTYEYPKLSALLRRCAEWYDSIMNVERYYPSIFRVAYYGQKFPPQIRNQEFIFRGAPLEQIIDFSSRARAKFPGSVLLELKAEIGPEHTDQNETYFMAISKLTPSTRPEMKAQVASSHVTDPLLPPGLKVWRANNCLDTFSYRRPYNKRKQQGLKKSANSTVFFGSDQKEKALDTDGEFRDLWVEFKYCRTQRCFPSTQRRILCVETSSVFRNPIEMAIETMEGKNIELEAKLAIMETLPDGGADQSYTMALNGVVDAAVNGGLANYVSFLDGTFRELNPEIQEDIELFPAKKSINIELAKLIEQQLEIMDRGIRIHSTKVCEAMKPLGAYMETNYDKMRKDAVHWVSKAEGTSLKCNCARCASSK
jgi:hypothetical protein